MKTLIAWTVALSLAVGLGLLLRYREGVVSIVLPPYRFDIGANTAALSLLIGFVALYFLVRIGLQILRAPGNWRNWRQARQLQGAHASLSKALVALNEGRSELVDKLVQAAMKHPETAGAATLLAARAAERRGDTEARDRWLRSLEAFAPLKSARLMFIAELAVAQGAPEQALASLDALDRKAGDSIHAARLRLRALEQSERWDEVLSNCTRLRKRGGIGEEAARVIRVNAYESLFEAAVSLPAQVDKLFKSLSRDDRQNPSIMNAAIEAFALSGQEKKAFKLIDETIGERLEPMLLVLFTRLSTISLKERLGCAERWLKQYPDNALILATLGRLCLAEGLWGKAETFLKRADELEPSPFTRLALAEMYDAVGRGSEATQLYRSLANEKPAALSVGGPAASAADGADDSAPPPDDVAPALR